MPSTLRSVLLAFTLFAGGTIPFCSSLFSFSAGTIVFQGSLIPCRITDAQNCRLLNRVFLSLFLCRIIFSTGFSVLHFKCSKSASSFSIPGSGDDRNLFFVSISPWAFNFFPLLICVFFNVLHLVR